MNTRRWLITISCCIVVLAALAGYKTQQIQSAMAEADAFPEPSATVEAVMTQRSLVQPSISTIGEIILPQTVELRNEIEGRIVAVNFISGAKVKQGDILLQLDVSEESARLQAAQARAELAKLELQRFKKLVNNNTISQDQLDQATAQYNISLADIAALEAVIYKKTLRAPFDATSGLHQLESGEFLQSNTLITTLIGINPYSWVDFSLPHKFSNADIGDSVSVTTAKHPGKTISGKIIAKDSVITSNSRNLRYRARLEQQITANAVVNVVLFVGAPQPQITLPVTAIRRDGLGNYVYVLDAKQQSVASNSPTQYRARRQAVNLGAEKNQTVVIKSGLQVDQLIAANGAFKLRNQLLVYVKQRPQGLVQTTGLK